MRSIRNKLTLIILLMAISLSLGSTFFGYQYYKMSMEDHYINLGTGLAKTVASFVDGDKIDYYLETRIIDEEYERTLALMSEFKEANNIEYIYVVKPTEKGTYYIYDVDTSEERCELGYFEYWYDDFMDFSKNFIAGEPIEPIISNESFGWLLSVYEPIYGNDGSVCGYVGADLNMDGVVHDRGQYLSLLVLITISITLVFVIIYLFFIRKTLIKPINSMVKAADNFLVDNTTSKPESSAIQSTSLAVLDINTRDELEQLANALKSMETKINEYIINLDLATRKAEGDVLTNLYNRGAFEQRVQYFLNSLNSNSKKIHAFFMIDLDNFKNVNDTFGHISGDLVLKDCANALTENFRDSDYVARIGGDEFAILCTNLEDIEKISKKAQKICDSWKKISVENNGIDFISASVGVSIAPKDGITYSDLYMKADKALYNAKLNGRDQFIIYDNTMNIH